MISELTLVRHGETYWNKVGKQQGLLNSDLTDVGRRQAKATAEALRGYFGFDVMYSSPLGRAAETAAILSETLQLDWSVEGDLQERNLGILQGLTVEEFARIHPAEYEGFKSRDPDYVLPEGESSRQRCERGNACIGSIAERHPGQRVLVVTHGGILDGVIRKIMSIPLEAPRMYSLFNCSINIISIADDDWRILTWGDVHHLQDLGALDDH